MEKIKSTAFCTPTRALTVFCLASVVGAGAMVSTIIPTDFANGGPGDLGDSCPTSGGYTGNADYIGTGPNAAPLRGTVACVDSPITDTDVRHHWVC